MGTFKRRAALARSRCGASSIQAGCAHEAGSISAAADRTALREAVDRRDREETIRSAHRMLGASRMIGAGAMAEACQILLEEARADKWSAVLDALEAFESEYARIMDEGAP